MHMAVEEGRHHEGMEVQHSDAKNLHFYHSLNQARGRDGRRILHADL